VTPGVVPDEAAAPQTTRLRTCRHPVSGGRCGAADGVIPYLVGPRCPAHTPARLAGRPEPDALLAQSIARRSAGRKEAG
jgi:hypothetical protein